MVMYSAIIKNKLRLAKGLLKHYWGTAIGLLLVAYFILHQLYFAAMSGGIGTTLSEKNIFYFLVACVALSGYRVLIKESPIITISSATLYYLYYTKHFNLIFITKYLWSFVKCALLTAIISGFFSGFQINLMFRQYFFLLFGYLFLGILLSWSRYHFINRKSKLIVIACYIISSIALLIEHGVVSIIFTWSFVLFWLYYVFFKLQFNLIKYSKDLALADEITSAGSRFDMGKMSQMAAENEAKKKRNFFLYQFPLKKNNAIFYKCFIETVRAGTRIWGIFIFLLFISFLIYRTSVFSTIPILGDIPALSVPLSMFAVMTVYLNIREMLKKQIGTLLDKHRQGLFLPMETRKILWSYMLFSGLLYAILTIIVGLILESNAYLLVLFYVLFISAFAVDFVIERVHMRFKKPFRIVIQLFSVALGYLFFV